MPEYKKFEYPDDMDQECIPLCDAINNLRGLLTNESCCGHGRREFAIWFDVAELDDVVPLLYFTDPCHVNISGPWKCVIHTDCAMSPVRFGLYGTIGEDAYADAANIVEAIQTWLADDEAQRRHKERLEARESG